MMTSGSLSTCHWQAVVPVLQASASAGPTGRSVGAPAVPGRGPAHGTGPCRVGPGTLSLTGLTEWLSNGCLTVTSSLGCALHPDWDAHLGCHQSQKSRITV